MPISLTLIEATAGREKAEVVARDLGLTRWDAGHDSHAFQLTRPFALTAIGNTIAFWKRERLGVELTSGVDEVSMALVADAWSRTYRSRAVTVSRTDKAVLTRNGLRVDRRSHRREVAAGASAPADRDAATSQGT